MTTTAAPPSTTTTFSLTGQIPLDVAGTLLALLGAAWPSTRVASDGRGMTFTIDDTDRVADPSVLERAADLRRQADEFDVDLYLGRLDAGGIAMTLPELFGVQMAALAQGMFSDQDPAVNYLETIMTTKDRPDQRWAVSVSRSTSRTPGELRQAAEARADEAEAEVRRLTALLEGTGPQ